MNRAQRNAFLMRHWIGITGLLVIYVLLTVVRSFRDDFGVEIWRDLGVAEKPEVFATSEFWVAIGVTLINGLVILIYSNRAAFLASIGLLLLGFAVIIGSIVGQANGQLSPMMFMVLLGMGMYIPYVAFHTTMFERLIAAFRETGTIGYLMYLADAVGYLGYVGVMIFRNTTSGEYNFLSLLIWLSVAVTVISSAASLFLFVYFRATMPTDEVNNAAD